MGTNSIISIHQGAFNKNFPHGLVNLYSLVLATPNEKVIGAAYYILNNNEMPFHAKASKELSHPSNVNIELFLFDIKKIKQYKLVWIEEIRIEKEFRKQSYMSLLIDIIKCNFLKFDLIVLRASPIEGLDRTIEGHNKLKNQYKHLGFKEYECNYMILKIKDVNLDFLEKNWRNYD